MKRVDRAESRVWLPQKVFYEDFASAGQLLSYNNRENSAVYIDAPGGSDFDMHLKGSKSDSVCIWNTWTKSGFVTKPKWIGSFYTLRFVTQGSIKYFTPSREYTASPRHATLTDFQGFSEVNASNETNIVSATFTSQALIEAQRTLVGDFQATVPLFAPVADMTQPGMAVLFSSVLQFQRRIPDMDNPDDLIFPLLQEILGFQLLSFWPRLIGFGSGGQMSNSNRVVKEAVDYIETNLQSKISLSEVANAIGVSARTLQVKFKYEFGKSPIQYIIDQRLSRAHTDLLSTSGEKLSVADIARRWGFVHMSDFSQRYRRLFGCTPRETRRTAKRTS